MPVLHRSVHRSGRSLGNLALLFAVAGGPLASPLQGQLATAEVEENVRDEPNGAIVATVLPGTVVDVLQERDRWVEARLEGWMWARSLQVTDRGGFDLVVVADEGENLRSEPQGTVVAKVTRGGLLEELERRPGWIRVGRPGWIWSESVQLSEPASPVPASEANEPIPPPTTSLARVPAAGLPVLSAPDGDTLARATPGTDLHVTGRQGSWVRVRVEGWAWLPDSPVPPGDSAAPSQVVDATPTAVTGAPESFRGRLVTWRLQYISLERAERVRTEFFEGEPFLLMRPTGGEGPFVYVAVPPERMTEVQGLTPLERFTVTGRVRVGASELTGSPILDLVELHRDGGR